MKDLSNERLILLATVQERMMDVAVMLEQWDNSRLIAEKNAFDSINISDRILNLSKEGNNLMCLLQQCFLEIQSIADSEHLHNMSLLLAELHKLIQNITETSAEWNDISHQIEEEVAYQNEIKENVSNHLCQIAECVDITMARTELLAAGDNL